MKLIVGKNSGVQLPLRSPPSRPRNPLLRGSTMRRTKRDNLILVANRTIIPMNNQ